MLFSRILSLLILSTLFAGAGWIVPPASAAAARAPNVAHPAVTHPAVTDLAVTHLAVPEAIAGEIERQASGRLKNAYARHDFRPLWASTGRIGPEADTFLGFLESADLDGLKPSSYKIAKLRQVIEDSRSGDPGSIALAELELSKALARYVADLRRRPKARMAYADERLKPAKKLREDAVVGAALLAQPFADYVSAMGWMSPHYLRMRNLLALARGQGAPPELLARIRLNLERARLLPGPWVHHIVVDAGSARLWYYQAGKQEGTMRVVVGTAETQTPMLAGMMQYAIFNPYWNIPTYLARKNIAQKVLSGRTLASMRIEALSDWSASPARLDPAKVDWQAVASGAQEIRLRELPGPANSMGKVKFLFPNDEGIYLHDTPNTDLFRKDDRHLSNGCIRLENAAGLGKWLLGKRIRFNAKQPEQIVALPVPVPVYLTYFTVTESADGVQVLPDVYGHDRQVTGGTLAYSR